MIKSVSYIQQDTIPRKVYSNHDSSSLSQDSVPHIVFIEPKDSARHKTEPLRQNMLPDFSDTTSVCTRNSIADVTFYNYNNFIFRIGYGSYRQFPFTFTEKARQRQTEEKAFLLNHLKPGSELPGNPLHPDWMILIILVAVSLYSLVHKTSGTISAGFARFFSFRGINDPVSRETGELFHWQSTILNLCSFLIIGLFAYSAVSYYNLIPAGFKGIIIWLIVLAVITSAVTLRHITCVLTGATSGQQEIFTKYLISIYQSYRIVAFLLFIITILISYTSILPVRDYILTGLIIIGIMYLIRVIRLLIIFLNRNISIFYLILYLCALEILPVLVIGKYFTGFF